MRVAMGLPAVLNTVMARSRLERALVEVPTKTCPVTVAVPAAAAVKLKKSDTPAFATMPVAVALAVAPVTVGTSTVAVLMLLPLRAGTAPSLLVMIATSSSKLLAPLYSPLLHCDSGL